MNKILQFIFLLLFLTLPLNAATYYLKTANIGAAQTASSWNTGGVGGGGTNASNFTTSGDIFIVSTGQAATCAGSPTFAAGVTLQLNGTGTINITGNGNTLTVNGILIFNSSNTTQITLAGSGSGQAFTLGSGATLKTVNTNGISGTNCSLPATASKATVTLSTGANYELNGTSAQLTLGLPATVATLSINNAVGVTLSSAVTVTTLTVGNVTGNSLFADGGFQVTSTGTLNLTSGTFSLGAAASTIWPAFATRNISTGTTVVYNSAVAQTVSITPVYQNLTFSGAGTKTPPTGTLSVGGNWNVSGGTAALNTNNSNVTVTGNITSGNITSGSGTISVGGSWTNSGTFTPGTGTVNFSGTAQSVNSLTYNNLTLSGSGIKTAAGTLTVNNTLNIVSGVTLDMAANTLNGTLATVTNSGAIKFNGASNGKAISTGTVEYYGTTQTVTTGTYATLTISSSGTKTAGGNLSATNLNNTGGSTLDMVGFTLSVSGTLNNTGSTIRFNGTSNGFATSSGTVEYYGTTQTLPVGTYNNLTISTSGTKTLGGITTVAGDLIINSGAILNTGNFGFNLGGNFTNSGTFTAGSSPIAIVNNLTQSITGFTTTGLVSMTKSGGTATLTGNVNGAGLTINGSGGTLNLGSGLTHTFTGDVTLTSGTLNGGSSTLNENSTSTTAWNGTGSVFSAGTGTVVFGGAAQTLSATATTFNNLTLSGSGVKSFSSANTISGILSMEGTASTSGTAPNFGTASTLQYNRGTSLTSGVEWVTPFSGSGGIVIANTGAITMNSDKILNSGASFVINSTASLNTGNYGLTFGGTFNNKGGTFTCGNSNITIAGTNGLQHIDGFTTNGSLIVTKTSGIAKFMGNVTCNSLTMNASGGTLSVDTTVSTFNFNGDVTIIAGTFDQGNAIHHVKGNISNNGNQYGNGKIVLTGGSTQHSISGSGQFGNIELDDINGAFVSSDLSVSSLKITSGIFSGSSHTITLTGAGLAWNNSNLSFNSVTSKVKMQGSSAQQMYGSTFYDLEINNPSGVTLQTSDVVTHQLTLTNGKLILNGNTMTLDAGAALVGNSGSTLSNFNNSNNNYIVTGTGDYLIQYVASSDVIYPIGTGTSFTPAILNNTGGTPDNYGVFVVASTANTAVPVECINKQWTVQEGSANLSNLIMTFQWNTSDQGIGFTGAVKAAVGMLAGTHFDVVDSLLPISGTNPRWIKMNQWQDMDFSGSNARTYAISAFNSSLPVELSSFTSTSNGRDVSLNWETKTEKNSDRFVIERSKSDANSSALNWVSVTSVKAAVLSNSPKQYTFTDKNLQAAKYQYRLKMIDNDGSFAYSKVVEAEVTLPKNFELSQNYPNPFNPATKISYSLANDSKVNLEVYNIIGEKVVQLVSEEQSAGYYTVNFGASSNNITSGIYFYKLTAVDNTGKNFSSIKKMMLLK